MIIGMAALITSCSHSDTLFHSFQQLPRNGWEKGDTIKFDIDSILCDGPTAAEVSIEIRCNRQYPYQKLWIIAENNFTEKDQATDTIHFNISNGRGKILGNGMNLYQYTARLKETTIDKGTPYHLHIIHFLRQMHLEGVESIGVKITRKQ